MKKLIVVLSLFVLAFAETGCSGEAVIATQPSDVVYTQPASPGAGYVWVDGDWYWSGGTYVYRNGYWAHPKAGRTWVRGNWDHRANGYHWNRGHWK